MRALAAVLARLMTRLILLAILPGAVSCGGPPKATIPVESPLRPFTPPEEEVAAPAQSSPEKAPQPAAQPPPPATPPAK